MAWEGPHGIKPPGIVAGADLSGKQYYFVKLSANKTAVACNAATDRPIGVLQNTPLSGQACEIVTTGVTKISSDVALSAGNLIGPSADGQAEPRTPGTDTTKYTCGQVIEGTGAANELATAVVDCAAPGRAS